MTQTLQFLLLLVATVAMSTGGLWVQARKAETMPDELLLGLFVVVALPLVLWSWFRRLGSEDPPMWWDLRQHAVAATDERLPVLEPVRANLFFPLPWFLLPMILVFGSVGLLTPYQVALFVPYVATVGWVGLICGYIVLWVLSHRSATSSGIERMLADFRHGSSAGAVESPEAWADAIFDRHRLAMDDETLETLYRAGLADTVGSSARWPGIEVTRLQPWYALHGWLCVLEERGLIPREDSRHGRHTTDPAPMEGWQCPRCRTVNVAEARRCFLRDQEGERVCRTRRPGLSRVADLTYSVAEVAQLLLYLALLFAPFLLIPILVVGVLVLIGSGDLTALLAGIAFMITWLVAIRILPDGDDTLQALGFIIYAFGAVLLWPFIALLDALLSVLRRAKRSARRNRSG